MYKLAQLKEAEVRGVLAALVDNGIVPVNNQDQFEKVAAETIDLVAGYDYDINDVAEASTYALNKVACEEEAQLALGQLTLQKVAGEIDDDAFDYYAAAIVKKADLNSDMDATLNQLLESDRKARRSVPTKVKDWIVDAAKANDIRAGWKKGADGKRAWGRLAKGLGKTGLVYGAPLAALGGGAYALGRSNKH